MKDKKTDIRKEITYKQLSESLFSLLKEKSIEDIKVIDICNKANIHRSTFYYHFNDKYELFAYTISEFTKEFSKEINENESNDIQEYYQNLIDIYLDHMHENKEIYLTMLDTNQNSMSLNLLFNIICNDVKKKLYKEQEKGYTFNIPIDIIAEYYVAGILKATEYWLKNLDVCSKEEFEQYLKRLILNKNVSSTKIK